MQDISTVLRDLQFIFFQNMFSNGNILYINNANGDRMSNFFANIIHNFLVAFGVILGASVFAGITAILTNCPPLKAMLNIASSIKIWAMAVALGDTFSSFEALEKGLFGGEIKSIIKQGIYVMTALLGANVGYAFLKLIQRCSDLWHG